MWSCYRWLSSQIPVTAKSYDRVQSSNLGKFGSNGRHGGTWCRIRLNLLIITSHVQKSDDYSYVIYHSLFWLPSVDWLSYQMSRSTISITCGIVLLSDQHHHLLIGKSIPYPVTSNYQELISLRQVCKNFNFWLCSYANWRSSHISDRSCHCKSGYLLIL